MRQLTRKRRGESAIIANLILFIGVMGMAAVAVAVFKQMVDENTNAASAEKTRTVNVMKTSFTIPSVTYTGSNVIIYVKNTGEASFDPEEVDVYLDGIRIPRNDTNRTVSVTSDTDLTSVGIWDEGEELELNVVYTYAIPETHEVLVVTSNGVTAEGVFSS